MQSLCNRRLVGGANGIRNSSPPRGANRKRIGTAKVGDRDKRDRLLAIGPELAVSGSDSAEPLAQDPAKAREFLGWSRVAGAKSLQPQTGWRWAQSIANSSLGRKTLIPRENTGKSPKFRRPGEASVYEGLL